MYQKILDCLKERPPLYASGTAPFWDDEHISAQMLAAHLNSERDAASRRHDFIRESAKWICSLCPPAPGSALLDLGCGPGLYARLFCEAGFSVTGVDISRRSLRYAEAEASRAGQAIRYVRMDYLDIDFASAFDAITLIYCDFGVLSGENRRILLQKARRALKPGGVLVLDGWAEGHMAGFVQGRSTQYCGGGFWSAEPYVCVESHYHYAETKNVLDQHVVITQNGCECYNIWNQIFTAQSLARELAEAEFGDVAFYDDVTGKPYTGARETLCAVARLSP